MSRKPKSPVVGSVLDTGFARSVSEIISVWQGTRGDKLDRVLTLRDLTESGMINATSTGSISTVSPDDGLFAPGLDPTTPTAPTGFAVSAAVLKAIISWDTNAASNHAHTEIWRNSVDDLGTATFVANTGASVYADSIDSGEIVYYWARHANTSGILGPYNATAGTSTEAARVLVGATPIQWENISNATADDITGALERTGSPGWTAGGDAENTVADGDLFMQWSSDGASTYFMGLSSSPASTASTAGYLSMDFSVFHSGAISYQAWKDGALVATIGTTPTAGDTLSMSVEGLNVVIRINGNVAYTWSSPGVTYPTQPHCAIYSGGVDAASWDRGNPGVHGFLVQGNISNGAITGLQLANLAVDTAAIADAAIVNAKIGNAEIDTAKIADYIQSTNFSNSGTYAGWHIKTRNTGAGAIYANELYVRNSAGQILLSTGAAVSEIFPNAQNLITSGTIGTYIATAAIKTAYIENLAVTQGKIANLAVDTLKIAGSAVTVNVSDGFTSYKTVSSWTTVASCYINAGSSGYEVDNIFFNWSGYFQDNGTIATFTMRVMYDGVQQVAGSVNTPSASGDGYVQGNISWVKENPTAGYHTLRVDVIAGSNCRCNFGAGFAIGTKR